MVYVLAVGTWLLVLMPIITCAAAEPVAFEVPMDPDGIQRVVVEADSYEFSPRHLVVRAGKPVELTVGGDPGRANREDHVYSDGAGLLRDLL